MENKSPTRIVTFGGVQAVITERKKNKSIFTNITFRKKYIDQTDGLEKFSSDFSVNDMPKIAKCADAAFEQIVTSSDKNPQGKK